MGRRILKWSLGSFCDMLRKRLGNNFDIVLFIDGVCGIGKSTLGYKICSRIKKNFNPQKDIVFSREDVMSSLAIKKNDVILADEMINVTYKRDFYLENQKKLLKMLDGYRDSCNLFIGCVPEFYNLDKHLQGRASLRLYVVRRGVAVVHMPIKSMYKVDKWDSHQNQRLEEKWRDGKPRYRQLSTFKGVLTFGDLTQNQKEIYNQIKETKRHHLFTDEEKAKDSKEDYVDTLLNRIVDGKVTREFVVEIACINKTSFDSLRARLNARLQKKGLGKSISEYLISSKKSKNSPYKEIRRKQSIFDTKEDISIKRD